MKNEHGLTQQQEAFAVAVAAGATQVDAYRSAYPRAKAWKDESVRVNAAKMSADANVVLRVRALQAGAAEKAELVASEIMREIKRVATSDIAGIMHDDGRMKLPNELDAATRAAVASFKIDEFGMVEYKFWDKNSALERSAKILGLFEADNKQKTDPLKSLLDTLSGNVVGPGGVGPKDDDAGDDGEG